MNLILTDIDLNIKIRKGIELVNVNKAKIANCKGCFACWTKTPGKCIIRDDAVKIYPLIAKSDNIIYISKIKYGSYDTPMKTLLERSLPIQQAFIRIYNNETHHVQRSVKFKNATFIIYGEYEQEEKDIFKKLVERNKYNMMIQNYKILFIKECDVIKILQNLISEI